MKPGKFFNNNLLGIVGAFFLAIIFFSGCIISQPPANQVKLAKDFTLLTLEGEYFTLREHFGQPILLYFFSTTCSHCQEETPNLVKMYEAYKNAGLLVIGVAVNVSFTQELRNFVTSYGITYPILIDAREEVSESYGVYYIPHNFFINREGEIVEEVVGTLTETELERKINNLFLSQND